MRIDGEWLDCLDGETRPIVRGEILLDNGTWQSLLLLVDTGADRTVLSANVLQAFSQASLSAGRPIGGLGGVVPSMVLSSQIRLFRDDGAAFMMRGGFTALTSPDALDMSVLGRDLLDRFTLVVDRALEVVALLAGKHSYSIHESP
jgi:predicted aspartyl protease